MLLVPVSLFLAEAERRLPTAVDDGRLLDRSLRQLPDHLWPLPRGLPVADPAGLSLPRRGPARQRQPRWRPKLPGAGELLERQSRSTSRSVRRSLSLPAARSSAVQSWEGSRLFLQPCTSKCSWAAAALGIW